MVRKWIYQDDFEEFRKNCDDEKPEYVVVYDIPETHVSPTFYTHLKKAKARMNIRTIQGSVCICSKVGARFVAYLAELYSALVSVFKIEEIDLDSFYKNKQKVD